MKALIAGILMALSVAASAQTVTMDTLQRTYAAISAEIHRLSDERRAVLSEGRQRAEAQRGTMRMQPLAQFRDDFGAAEAARLDERINKLQADQRTIMAAMRAIVAAN